MEEIEYLGQRIRRWRVGPSTFLAWPERGARLVNWTIDYPDGSFRDVIHWPQLDDVSQFVKARGGNPILFPFCARAFDRGEIHHWRDPSGKRRPMPMHGFARQSRFEPYRVDATGFAARLALDEEARAAYPFDYDFDVIYRFEERQLSVELRLSNRDRQSIPWSAGNHFYFALPWLDGTRRRDYRIRIPARKAVRHRPDGSLLHLSSFNAQETLDNPECIDRIHYELTSPKVLCECLKDGSRAQLEIGAQKRPRPSYACVTWTESDASPFYCIESWMGPPNSPETEIGLHLVPPGETEAFTTTVSV